MVIGWSLSRDLSSRLFSLVPQCLFRMREILLMKSVVGFLLAVSIVQSSSAAGKQLTGAYAPAASPALAPAEAQKAFAVPPGFEVRLFAAEPDVINPVAMTWDARGRLWVLELYEYPSGAAAGQKPRDRVKILEDTDNDGRADKVTVFADGLNLATGMLLGNGGVYVGQAPEFLFLQDTNHDDVADTRTVLLNGFGLDDRHELLNGFTWGPDGYLYMTHGVFTHSKVKIPEASAPGVEVTAAVARYHPVTRKFEVFADGTSNPWGVDFDASGNAFVSACVIDHLFHMSPAGIYARQGGTPANPYAYELLPSIVEHKHHMAAYCGICVYQGNQFPKEYQGHVFMGNIHQNAINHDRLEPNGATFKARPETDFLTTTDGWFRPVSEQVGPDGALWVADWYDKYPCYQNAQADPEGVDRERGRIWRVVYNRDHQEKMGSRPITGMNLAQLSVQDLVKLLEHPNIWQRRTAQRMLTERLAGAALPEKTSAARAIEALLEKGPAPETRLAALWTLHGTGLLRDGILDRCAADKDSSIRMWAARLTGENKNDESVGRLARLAEDTEATVRAAVAVASRQLISSSLTVDRDLGEVNTGEILVGLVQASSSGSDPLLPFLIWMAAEPGFATAPEGGLQWLANEGAAHMPLAGTLTRKAMRRLCDLPDHSALDLVVDFLGNCLDHSEPLTLAAIEGLLEAQRAKPLIPKISTDALFTKLRSARSPELRQRAQQLGSLWGNEIALKEMVAAINDATLPSEARSKAIMAARELKSPVARPALLTLVEANPESSLATEAIRALGDLGGESVADELLKVWPKLSGTSRVAAADVLVSRKPWAMQLLGAVEARQISAGELPLTAVRSLGESRDDGIRERALQVIGRIRPANADKQKLIEQKKRMILAGGPPDFEAGHQLVAKTCLICHKFYGEGAEVGPDLTGVGRSTLDALLANVIDPNLVVGKGYENVEVETRDGRSVSGRMVENTDTRIKLLAAGPKEEVLAKSDITNLRVSELSVMPEGLEQMPDQDFRNLILYVLRPPQETKSK